jgi:hypothetical protein
MVPIRRLAHKAGGELTRGSSAVRRWAVYRPEGEVECRARRRGSRVDTPGAPTGQSQSGVDAEDEGHEPEDAEDLQHPILEDDFLGGSPATLLGDVGVAEHGQHEGDD